MASNLSDSKGLDGHLLPGLDPYGVPQNLKGSVYPFEYNNFDKLDNLVKTKNIGVIKMEVFRNKEPENDFLHRVRKLANDNNIVLVFDECTSGFRETYGGLHLKYNIFQKSLLISLNHKYFLFQKNIMNRIFLSLVITFQLTN